MKKRTRIDLVNGPPRKTPLIGMFAVLVCLAGATLLPANPASPSEYQIKSVFLFNFAQFVEWPSSSFTEPREPLVIGILGEDPFGSYLDETVQGETTHDRPLVVRRFRLVEDIKNCHILFISQSEEARVEKILASLKGRRILTVGDCDAFAQRGGMIRLVTENNKIRLQINLDSVKAEDITISSKLLRPAEIVGNGKD